MKIAKIEDLHCDAGWRDFSFLKITTDDGIVGWSEYNEGYGSAGITAVIRRMAAGLIGENPRAVERIMSMQYAITRQAPGGVNQQAMAAIENALLDVKAKSLGVPVYELFGGRVRDRLPLYWSHCGSYRFRNADMMGVEPVRSFDDVVKLGKHVKERGFKALKTNIFRFDLNPPDMYQPGFGRTPGGPFWGIHGTAMASLIAGHGHGQGGSEGMMGVAPKAKILSVRVTLESNDPGLGNPGIAARPTTTVPNSVTPSLFLIGIQPVRTAATYPARSSPTATAETRRAVTASRLSLSRASRPGSDFTGADGVEGGDRYGP